MKHRVADAACHDPASPVADDRRSEPSGGAGVWYRAELCGARLQVQQVPVIQRHFVEALGSAGWPIGASLFVRLRQRAVQAEDRPEVDALYFSPASISAVPHLIVASGARPSAPPERAGATLLAGGSADWALLPFHSH